MSVIHHSHLKSETSKSVTFDTETVKVTVSKMSSNRNTQKRRTDSGGTVSVQSDTLSASPQLVELKSILSFSSNRDLIYEPQRGSINYGRVSGGDLRKLIVNSNTMLSGLFQRLLIEYYPKSERDCGVSFCWMKTRRCRWRECLDYEK